MSKDRLAGGDPILANNFMEITSPEGESLVVVGIDGKVTLGGPHAADEGAKSFWDTIGQMVATNIAGSIENRFRKAILDASAHVYRQQGHGRHEQDRIDATKWLKDNADLIRLARR